MNKFESIEAFKAHPAEDARLRKSYACEVKASDTGRALDFTISTESVDRQGDTIAVEGWQFANYLKNPVVLWAHDYTSLPVAKATKLWHTKGAIHATAEFTPAGMARFNDVIFEMYKGGFLSAASVGFQPIKWAFTEDKDRRFGIDFMEQELLEFSCVPVPANPDALIEARSAGHDTDELRAWALETIKQIARPATPREFESLLRDVGYSQKEAKEIASHGYSLHRESEAAVAPKKAPSDSEVRALRDGLAMALR